MRTAFLEAKISWKMSDFNIFESLRLQWLIVQDPPLKIYSLPFSNIPAFNFYTPFWNVLVEKTIKQDKQHTDITPPVVKTMSIKIQ